MFPTKKEYIYILYEGEDRFKIGRTSRITKRLAPYKTHNSQIEGYLAVFEVKDSKFAESVLHRKYDSYKVKGEFFELPIEELKKLESSIVGLKTSYLSNKYLDFLSLV